MKKKTHKIHLSTLNVHSARRKAILYFTAFIRGLSSDNGVLSNGYAIRYINAFPYYRSTSKGAHYFHRVVHLVVLNIDQWVQTQIVNLSEVFTNPGLWTVTMTDAARIEIVTRGTAVIQNKSGPFSITVRASDKAKGCTRSLTTDWFYRRLDNGEKDLRSWMIYSRAHECLYCFYMRLVL